ncbi:protein MID1-COMPLEMENTING ACTIVITY 1-like [Bidens hawaiensis]|uniref:protein MID1-COMPLEMENTING ACTIVITY 1-like n=1 Tax=Bidens hawaiensis TaxID=980011 RepID=UPI0040490E1E
MAAAWEHFGEIASVAQLTGLDAGKLIGLIVQAANTARMHKKNCKQFANHLKLIGNLLQQLKLSELEKYPETREPLEQLEDALRRSYILVNSCQDRSYLYLLANGWNIVYQFRKAQNEIDRYLKIIPLITLVDNARVRERLDYIEMDQREYTLDDEDRKVQDVIMKPVPSDTDADVLKKSLCCSYPHLPFNKAIQKESEKLHVELEHSQANLDVGQCQVIQHLIEVTEVVASKSESKKDPPNKSSKKVDSDVSNYKENRNERGSDRDEEWHSDLLGCCSEPLMCIKTFLFPCGAVSKLATVATG